MSFLFGKSKKNQNSALPAATRDLGSSHGQNSSIPVANGGLVGPRNVDNGRNTPTQGASVNNSQNSLSGSMQSQLQGQEPKSLAVRPDGESQQLVRGAQGPQRPPGDSPYPWSQRRINFSANANPFPRYGPAVNSSASKDGIVYLMGGLVNGTTVKGDLWMCEAGNANMPCYPVPATGDGPGPRVGHSSLLVGNAFIVFGGDTKMDEGDQLDDNLYLLNTSTKHWSKAVPSGNRPTGRYGHTLNLLGSRIFIFGGQVEGFFFNDLVAFDLNALQSTNSTWETLIPNSGDEPLPQGLSPPARTNHTIITYNDKLYLFGGTDGNTWFNDVWTYDPRVNAWTELDCIGYIPTPREGHAAALVNDTMYVFGGRTKDGNDLGDLAAFRIPSRRWYMFQNMGPAPSPRSGHSMTAFGRHIVVLAGEPSSSPSNREELSCSYVLDTSKIRYPASDTVAPQTGPPVAAPPTLNDSRIQAPNGRKISNEKSVVLQGQGSVAAARQSVIGGPRNTEPQSSGIPAPAGSRLPRAAGNQAPPGPPPQQQPPQPRANGTAVSYNARSRTPTKDSRGYGPGVENLKEIDRLDNASPTLKSSPVTGFVESSGSRRDQSPSGQSKMHSQSAKASMDTTRSGSLSSRSGSRAQRQQYSIDSVEQGTPRPSADQVRGLSREAERPIDSGVGSSPALFQQQNDDLIKELDAARSKNAWFASELALARKAGYNANTSNSPVFEERSPDTFGDEDRPLVEALLRMKAELKRVQETIDDQARSAAGKIAEVEKQRDAAVNEAVYAKAKLAAHGGGSQAGTPQPDGGRGVNTPDIDRVHDISRKLANSLAFQTELSNKIEALTTEVEAERRAKQLAEETAEAAQTRVSELDTYRQRNASEVESLRAELHEVQRAAREEAANAAEAKATARLLTVDKQEIETKLTRAVGDTHNHSSLLQSLRDAVAASSDRASMFERKFEEERQQRVVIEQKFAQIRSEQESQMRELDSTTARLRDAEELAQKHAAEAETHRSAVLIGLGKSIDMENNDQDVIDERVTILQQQVEAANILVRNNQNAADVASDKLRRAEERIAGLEAYQEQTSRESLTIRKQLQVTMKECQNVQRDRDEMLLGYEKQRLESNALEIQLKTLKGLLEERGINPSDARRSRGLDSPNSRFGTPELGRMRELEQQLDASLKAHDEMRSTFEQQQSAVNKEWEDRVSALSNDHQAAVKYLRGTEKMLAKMKQELDRYKAANTKLEEQLVEVRQKSGTASATESAAWEGERDALRREVSALQDSLKQNVGDLETRLSTVQNELQEARKARDAATAQMSSLEAFTAQSKIDLENLRRDNALLDERAKDAESRVQRFLDQFENSVDNYRRQSTLPPGAANGMRQHNPHDSIAGESLYSNDDAHSEGTATAEHAADRNSLALDSLATELDALRSQWETTNKNYRLSDRFDFERTPTTEKDFSESLGGWNKGLAHGDGESKASMSQATGLGLKSTNMI
ncbi:hypothetical protein EJ05DRAFT_389232 [Pseudovirgaria hyperparasitica]|uniref:Cell polarity protein-like protein n=1 Tax=Pseudovirgaria hyperparasitica TaxID=470096 RepID=A0A6A6W695_9PEZI|nr:uncharacterized protein EJ05DRAFT_389232 [Pseudovirgaria hyperparasitica]KAF2757426.1 hypothetical protein EJ05DRAFT_389232 [Pseudovirgaria hyperparasitica]